MNCEFCNSKVNLHTAFCSNCGRFGRTISEYIKYHKLDVPEFRLDDINWLRRNVGVRNSNHPAYPRLIEMLKQV